MAELVKKSRDIVPKGKGLVPILILPPGCQWILHLSPTGVQLFTSLEDLRYLVNYSEIRRLLEFYGFFYK